MRCEPSPAASVRCTPMFHRCRQWYRYGSLTRVNPFFSHESQVVLQWKFYVIHVTIVSYFALTYGITITDITGITGLSGGLCVRYRLCSIETGSIGRSCRRCAMRRCRSVVIYPSLFPTTIRSEERDTGTVQGTRSTPGSPRSVSNTLTNTVHALYAWVPPSPRARCLLA